MFSGLSPKLTTICNCQNKKILGTEGGFRYQKSQSRKVRRSQFLAIKDAVWHHWYWRVQKTCAIRDAICWHFYERLQILCRSCAMRVGLRWGWVFGFLRLLLPHRQAQQSTACSPQDKKETHLYPRLGRQAMTGTTTIFLLSYYWAYLDFWYVSQALAKLDLLQRQKQKRSTLWQLFVSNLGRWA